MKIKKILSVLLIVLLMLSCKKIEPSESFNKQSYNLSDTSMSTTNNALDYYQCGGTNTSILKTSNYLNIGSVTVTNNFEFIEVTISSTNNWVLNKTRIFIGLASNVPLNNNGSVKLNMLPYIVTHPWDTDTYKLRVLRSSISGIPVNTGNIIVIVQADVSKINKITCAIYDNKSAYGVGVPFNNSSCNITYKIPYFLNSCVEV